MLKFIPGILLLQAITVVLVLIAPSNMETWGWLRLAIPVLIAGFLTAFWFGALAARQRNDQISRLKEHHAKDREALRVNAERAKTRLVKEAQRKTLQEVRRASRRANIRIGLAFAGVAGFGGLLLLTQFMSIGVLLLTTSGGGLGGYLLRIQQEKGKLHLFHKDRDAAHRPTNVTPDKPKQPPRIEAP